MVKQISKKSQPAEVDEQHYSSGDDSTAVPLYKDVLDGSSSIPETTEETSISGKRSALEEQPEETKTDKRKRLKSLSLQDAIAASLSTERQASVAEIQTLKLQLAAMAADQLALKEEMFSQNKQTQVKPDANYGFFETVILLESVTDVTKPKVMSVVSQFRNPTFNKSIVDCIQPTAKRYIDFEFKTNGFAETDEDISSWSKVEYIDNLEKLFQNTHHNTTTQNRFSKLKLTQIFATGKLSPALCNSIFEAVHHMTSDEVNDLQFQKSLINRAFNLLSSLEPVRILLTSKVQACKTFEEFFMLWTRYKVSKQTVIDDLTAEGYVISPKVYLMASKEVLNTTEKHSKQPQKNPTNF